MTLEREDIERLVKLESKLDSMHDDIKELKQTLVTKVERHGGEISRLKNKVKYLAATLVALASAMGYHPLTGLFK